MPDQSRKSGYEHGFDPSDENGRMFNKKYYGLHVPDQEDFDEMNATGLRREGRLPSKPGVATFGKDGFQRIDVRKIKPANQDQYIDAGKIKSTQMSHTFSGYVRKKGGRGKTKKGY